MSKKHRTGQGSYEIVGTISRDSQHGTTVYSDTVTYIEHADGDQDAVQQWKATLAPNTNIVKYTVIFLGILIALLLMSGGA